VTSACQNGERGIWVGVHSSLANRMVERALEARWFSELGDYDTVRREVKFAKNSRVDFILSTTGADGAVVHEKYVEVKSVTLASSVGGGSRCAVFPDTVSTRAQKHVTELTELVEAAAKKKSRAVSGAIVFLVQRDDCQAFAPSIVHDPAFAALCALAAKSGIQLLGYACALEPDEDTRSGRVRLLHALPLQQQQQQQPKDGEEEDE
jgi:sugar fermentation stimulation protein A